MRHININEDILPLNLLDEIYKAETQINEGKGILHKDAKVVVVMKSVKVKEDKALK